MTQVAPTRRPPPPQVSVGPEHTAWWTVLPTAALRGAAAALAGLVLAAGVAVLLWAVTPSSEGSPVGMLRGAAAAFAGAHGMPVQIGAHQLTLPPLALAVVSVAVLWVGEGRGRVRSVGVAEELGAVLAGAVGYALVATLAGTTAGPAAAIRGADWWRPATIALVVLLTALLVRPDGAVRGWWDERVGPTWRVAVRLTGVGIAAVLGGAAVVLSIALAMALPTASAVGNALAPGVADGFGLTLLCVAYLPNAVLATVGYTAGPGFVIGAGSYSPFGSTLVDLPGIPLIAATPQEPGMSTLGLLALLVPIGVGVLIGRSAAQRVTGRRDRVLVPMVAGLATAVVVAVVAGLARGGVSGGPWPTSGASPWLLAVTLGAELAAVGAATAALLPTREPAGAAEEASSAESESDVPGPDEEPVADEEPVVEEEPVADEEPVAEEEPVADDHESVDQDPAEEQDDPSR